MAILVGGVYFWVAVLVEGEHISVAGDIGVAVLAEEDNIWVAVWIASASIRAAVLGESGDIWVVVFVWG